MPARISVSDLIKVNALDPGVTTGYASGIIEDGSMGVISGQAVWNELQLYRNLQSSRPDIIVYERFEYRSTNAYSKSQLSDVELFPRNLIGIINLYAQKAASLNLLHETGKVVKLYPQLPAYALGKNAYFTDQKLKAAKVYKVASPHANDAMRHLLQWWQFGPGFEFNTSGFEPLA